MKTKEIILLILLFTIISFGFVSPYINPPFIDIEFNKNISHSYYCVGNVMGPFGEGVEKGNIKYEYPYSSVFWTYEKNLSVELKSCMWRCEDGYLRDPMRMKCLNISEIKGDVLCVELGCPDNTNYVGSIDSDIYHECKSGYAKRIKSSKLMCFTNIPSDRRPSVK